MKKKNFLMLALAAVAFAACSNEDLVPVDNPGNNNDLVTDPNGEAWVALAVKTPTQTRGLNTPDQEAATEAESKITKVRAIFFTANATEDAATVTADITLTDDQAGLDDDGMPSGAGKAFKVPATSKRILIIANPSATFDAKVFSTTTTYAEVNAALSDAVSTLTTSGHFMMSNAKGSLEPSETDDTNPDFGKAKDLALYKNETAATNNPLSIRIDRVVAKVRMYITETSDNSKVKIEESGWILNVTNKTYFPASKRTLTWNENPSHSGARGTCITPFDQYKIGSYRIDPNYGTQAAGSYNSYDSSTDPTTVPWKMRAAVGDGATEYCLENTQTQPYNVHEYTTQVLLKAKFVPREYGRPAPNDGTPSKVQEATPGLVGDWMLINGGFYTPTTLMEWIAAELTAKYADDEPTTFPTVRTTAYNRYLDAVSVGAIALPATADAADLANLILAFEGTITNLAAVTAENRAKSVTGLTYYVNAVSYYKIMVKHDDTGAATNELGEFGVVRNSVYDIKVKAFNNPGYPAIPDPDQTPDETDEGWLSIEIITNPWTWYTQEEIM